MSSASHIGNVTYGSLRLWLFSCGGCGHIFALNEGLKLARWEDHQSWYCSACGASYAHNAESTEERLRRQLKSASDSRDYERTRADHEEKRAISYRGHVTRIKNRVAKGVCPCCKRSFTDLRRHMTSKHPGYTQEKIA